MTPQEMHHIMDDMIAFLQKENKLLESSQTDGALLLMDEKSRHIARYAQMTAYVKCNQPLIKALPLEIKQKLFEKVQFLHELTQENENKVTIVKSAGERFMRHLTSMTQKASKPVEGYTQLGAYARMGRHMGGSPVSLTLNQST